MSKKNIKIKVCKVNLLNVMRKNSRNVQQASLVIKKKK